MLLLRTPFFHRLRRLAVLPEALSHRYRVLYRAVPAYALQHRRRNQSRSLLVKAHEPVHVVKSLH